MSTMKLWSTEGKAAEQSGRGKAIQASRDERGNIHTAPQDMAHDFKRHWERVFRASPTYQALRRRWFQEDLTPAALASLPNADSAQWKVQRSDVIEAIKRSGHSSPGPDGIPVVAYRALANLAVDVLFDALKALGSVRFLQGCHR